MSLDVYLSEIKPCEVFSANITHNLGEMANAAGIYYHVWRPEEIGIKQAKELIEPLTKGIAKMRENPKKFRAFDAPNGWGLYDNFLPWLEKYLEACMDHPNADISVSR